MFNDSVYNFLKISAKLSEKNVLFLCDKENCYIETSEDYQKEYNDFKLSDNVKNIINETKISNKRNQISININKESNKEFYSGFMVHNINDKFFLISTNNMTSFHSEHEKFATTTIEFLKEMLKDSK